MSRESIHAEMKELLGQVPGFFGSMPDDTLEAEWSLFKHFEMGDSSIAPKFRELIGVGVAAAQRCWYCANFHMAMARFHGATDAQIQEAAHLAKFGTSWSSYLNGTLYDQDQFLKELGEIGAHLSK
jgi:AhpD family alkylhydroperoxidase